MNLEGSSEIWRLFALPLLKLWRCSCDVFHPTEARRAIRTGQCQQTPTRQPTFVGEHAGMEGTTPHKSYHRLICFKTFSFAARFTLEFNQFDMLFFSNWWNQKDTYRKCQLKQEWIHTSRTSLGTKYSNTYSSHLCQAHWLTFASGQVT